MDISWIVRLVRRKFRYTVSLFRPGTRLIRFGRFAEPAAFNRTQELFMEWNAQRLGIPLQASRERYVASWASLPQGYAGRDYREFCVLSHEVFRVFWDDTPAEAFEAYKFHCCLHFLRFLSYREPELLDEAVLDAVAQCGEVCILDYGCGLAQGSISLAERLQKKGARVSLVFADVPSLVTDFVMWMAARLSLRAQFVACDAQNPYPSFAPCHICIAKEVFEHVHEPVRAFRGIDEALLPGGYLVANITDHLPEYFHVSPDLAPLRAEFRARGYQEIGTSVFRKPDASS